jgi:hypothetical protein
MGYVGFGRVSRDEKRQAELFFADLIGRPARRRRRPTTESHEAFAESGPLIEGPLSESEWRSVLWILTRGEAQVGAPLTADADRNALLVAARIFCDRNALRLEREDPLLCLVNDVTVRDPRVRALVPHVTARGPIVDWTRVPVEARVLRVMTLLVRTYGYPVNGAAGLVGNLRSESRLLPQSVEGSGGNTPMRAPNFAGTVVDFTPDDIVNRNEAARRGPARPGVGLAQWTFPSRRTGLFGHTFRGVTLGPRILFDMDAQVDYLVSELRTLSGFAGVQRVLTNPAVAVDAASDEVVYNMEIPRAILEGGRKLPRTDPRVIRVFGERRPSAQSAARLFSSSTPATATATAAPAAG